MQMKLEGKVSVIKTVDSKSESTTKHTKHIVINQENGCKVKVEVEPNQAMGLNPGDSININIDSPQRTVKDAAKK